MIDSRDIQAGRKVLIFRNELLPRSETFIVAQAKALREYEPRFAGTNTALDSLTLSSSPVLVDSSGGLLGKLRRRLFWRTSIAPGFYRRLKKMGPSLVHAHFAPDGAAALPISHALRIPLVVTLHGYDVTSSDSSLRRSPEGRLYLRRRKLLWEDASVFLCVSEFIRDRAREKGFPKDKLRVHYTGVDVGLFAGTIQQRDPNLIVFVGRLVEKKGCTYLLDALALIQQQHPTVRLAVIGSGPLEAGLRCKAIAEHLPCEFLGAQPPHVVREHLASARVFCVPSVTASNGDSEGLGTVFAEAQAMGTPVASSRHAGMHEIVLHGETGLLAPERDAAMLAANLLTLLREDRMWLQYSRRGMSWVRDNFDLHKQTAQLEQIYDAVLSAPERRSAGVRTRHQREATLLAERTVEGGLD